MAGKYQVKKQSHLPPVNETAASVNSANLNAPSPQSSPASGRGGEREKHKTIQGFADEHCYRDAGQISGR